MQDGFPVFAPDISDEGGKHFPQDAHEKLFQLEAHSFWFVSRNKLLLHMLNHYFSGAKSMLEIGCGTGFVLSFMAENRPEIKFFGAEAYLSGLKYAKRRLPAAEFAQMDACRMPFVDEFDVIGAFDVLEHIDNDGLALAQIYRSIKPDGGLILTVPQHNWLWSNIDVVSEHKRRYCKKVLKEKLEKAGFKLINVTSFITLLLPFMLASRMISNFSKNSPTQSRAGLCLPDTINSFFTRVCEIELALIRRKFSLPVGGSLLCVAMKQGG